MSKIFKIILIIVILAIISIGGFLGYKFIKEKKEITNSSTQINQNLVYDQWTKFKNKELPQNTPINSEIKVSSISLIGGLYGKGYLYGNESYPVNLRWGPETDFYKHRTPTINNGDTILVNGTFWGLSENGDVIIDVINFSIIKIEQKQDSAKLSDYYQNLAKKCIEEPVKIEYMGEVSFSSDCCMASVRAMADKNGQLIEGDVNSCPAGFQLDMLRCPGSYKWCESCAKEGQTIGAAGMPEMCCSGLKSVGGWPGGYTGDCSKLPPPTGLSICTKCGDGICNIGTGENKCNCPTDCK